MQNRQELDRPSPLIFPPKNAPDVTEDEFITNLLKRQDVVLEQLDELNLRVEQAILDIGKAREEAIDTAPTDDEPAVQAPAAKAA